MKIHIIQLIAFVLCTTALSAQNYAQIVTCEKAEAESATFTSVGVAEKAKDVANNAAESLFYTLFYEGVDGVNGGRPLITTDNKANLSAVSPAMDTKKVMMTITNLLLTLKLHLS